MPSQWTGKKKEVVNVKGEEADSGHEPQPVPDTSSDTTVELYAVHDMTESRFASRDLNFMKLNRQLSLMMIERIQPLVHEQQPCVKRARTAAIITLPDPQQAGKIATDYTAATSSIESENRQKKKHQREAHAQFVNATA